MDSDDRRNPHRFKSRRIAFFAVYISVVLVVGLINWGILFPPTQRELIDTATVQSWVPVYIIHNPPGETSRSGCRANYTPVTLRLEGMDDGITIDTTFNTHIGSAWFGTGVGFDGYLLNALFLEHAWSLWRYVDGTNIWFEAELDNSTYRGWAILGTDDASFISEQNILVWDTTGSESQYALELVVPIGTTKEVTIEWTQSSFATLGLGYTLNLFGHDFQLNVSLSVDVQITNTYLLGNNMSALSTSMYCNGPITEVGNNHYHVDGALIWFSE